MRSFALADTVHRLVKQAMDSGEAESLEAAERLFRGFELRLSIGAREAREPAHQAALLTAVALARRVFLGGVHVVGDLDVPIVVPATAGTLVDAVRQLGGTVSGVSTSSRGPHVAIGGALRPRATAFDVRLAFAGWRGGVVPADVDAPDDSSALPLAAMLAAAFAVSEAFAFVRGEGGGPGRRDAGLSLWKPQEDWLHGSDVEEPILQYLPSRLWLIGLGHLGQAYLWALGLLPYSDPGSVDLVLQDIDVITPSTESTSVLTDSSLVGQRKTRSMAAWAERRGFATTICERKFDARTVRGADEPGVALCGVDNSMARRALDAAGFDLVVEAGLGRGYNDFRALRVHVLPGQRPAAELWRSEDVVSPESDRAAYRSLRADGLDQCGATLLAGKAVGAPFVGAVAACLVIAEVLRLLHGARLSQVIDLDLSAVEQRTVVEHGRDFGHINPGFVRSR